MSKATDAMGRRNGYGRQIGTKHKFPRGAKAAMIALLEQYAIDGNLEKMAAAIDRGIAAKPPGSLGYISLIVDHLKGLPDQRLDISERVILAPRDPTPTKK